MAAYVPVHLPEENHPVITPRWAPYRIIRHRWPSLVMIPLLEGDMKINLENFSINQFVCKFWSHWFTEILHTGKFLNITTGWWFGSFFFPYIGNNNPDWLILFRGVGSTTNQMGMDQYLLIPFLVGWTSIYQLFWGSPGVQGFDPHPDHDSINQCVGNNYIDSPKKLDQHPLSFAIPWNHVKSH
jgi:hypothetical protein